MHPLEVEVAERIVAMCPGVEAVRFGKTGSDALSAACEPREPSPAATSCSPGATTAGTTGTSARRRATPAYRPRSAR